MTIPKRNILKSLPIQMAIPVVITVCLVGFGLYFFVLRSVSEFTDEQIKTVMSNIASEIYDICDESLTELMQTGKMDDEKAGVIKKALTIGTIEEYAQRNNIGCRLTQGQKNTLFIHQINPELINFIAEYHLKGLSSVFEFKGKKYYFQHFDFKPWGWHIGLIKDTKAYAPLIARVKFAYSVTGILLILGLILILILQERFLRRPLNQIISATRTGQLPGYKGIFELEFLSDNISSMMQSLEGKNKWVESLYLIAITNRGEDFFNRLAHELSDALDVNTLIMGYSPAEDRFRLTAFSQNDPGVTESIDPCEGWPNQQIIAEKKSIIIASDAYLAYPSAPCLVKTQAQTYVGMPIIDRGGSIIGMMNIFGNKRRVAKWDLNLIKMGCQMAAVEFEYLTKESDKKKLEGQLQQSQKMEAIGTLAGGIAHDFNNILFPLLGHTEMLLHDMPEGSPAHDKLEKIYAGGIRARDLVRQILTFSRQEKFELIPIKLKPVVEEALKFVRSTIPSTIAISHDISSFKGQINADATQINQVIMNLATNAYHAMEKTGGTLNVTLKEIEMDESEVVHPDMPTGTYACLTVSDTGVGMDNILTKKIFDPFFTTKEKGKGTGMGLSVVHGIIDRMNGKIHAVSVPGKGTTFIIYFPVLRLNGSLIP